jgi:hypothetical protein
MKETVELLAKLSAVTTLFVALFSVIYEWAYFLIVGREFQRFASASDYLTDALEWIPTIILVTFISAFINFLVARIKNWPADYRDFGTDFSTWRFNTSVLFVGIFLLASAAISYLFLPPTAIEIYILILGFGWPFVVRYIFTHENAPNISGTIWGTAITYGPIISVFSLTLGLLFGVNALGKIDPVYSINLSKGDASLKVIILKNFERGLLIRDPVRGIVEFIPWEQIKTVDRTVFPESINSRSCQTFGWPCLGARPTPFN